MDNVLGIGVLGLHEGRTLIMGLNKPAPPSVGMVENAPYRSQLVRVMAGCDLDDEKIASVKQVCPDLFYTNHYEVMLARNDLDIIAIYTPDSLHGDHIVRAFETGKHVICTKPLVNSLEDAQRVWASAKQTGKKLLVGQSTRFFESFQRQRKAFENGALGEIEFADAHYIHRMDWFYDKSAWATNSTDWVFLGLSHPADLIRWYLGEIEEVQAYGTHSKLAKKYNVQSFDIYTVNVKSKSGKIGRIMGHYGLHELPSARNAIELMLYGSEGTSMAQYHDMRYVYSLPDGTEVKEDMLYSKRGYYFNNEVHGMHYGEFSNYADHFAKALLTDTAYAPNLREGLQTFVLMETIRQSALTGKSVYVDTTWLD